MTQQEIDRRFYLLDLVAGWMLVVMGGVAVVLGAATLRVFLLGAVRNWNLWLCIAMLLAFAVWGAWICYVGIQNLRTVTYVAPPPKQVP